MANIKSHTRAVIYLTGMGDGFPASIPGVFQSLSGLPVIQHVLKSAQAGTNQSPFLFMDQIRDTLPEDALPIDNIVQLADNSNLVEVVVKSKAKLSDSADHFLFVPGDMPLLRANTLEKLVETHLAAEKSHPSHAMITVANVRAYGSADLTQVTTTESDRLSSYQTTAQPPADPREVPAYDGSIYCISSKWYWEILSQSPDAVLRDFQLPSLVQLAHPADLYLQTFQIPDQDELLRIASQVDLAKAAAVLRSRTNLDFMRRGVAIIDPNTTYIDVQVEIGEDTVIHPQTYLRGSTSIGNACEIGPNSLIQGTSIGDRCKITFSVTENAVLEDDVDIGPFAHLRKGAHLARGVHMGNYGEVKNSYLGPGSKMGHFSYIGDATIGAGVNIGAGVITANYDGQSKHTTEIGAGAFIGSDTMLVAPLKIGAGARTGAGSVVTKDVPPNSLAVGIPARVIRKIEDNNGP
jgi:bifunctional UDP-N-acetylglucosamine pyrophosphorylase/glucosamine-1-phosphate N-acetyltransferase